MICEILRIGYFSRLALKLLMKAGKTHCAAIHQSRREATIRW